MLRCCVLGVVPRGCVAWLRRRALVAMDGAASVCYAARCDVLRRGRRCRRCGAVGVVRESGGRESRVWRVQWRGVCECGARGGGVRGGCA